ncbi:MAG: hypothetical protein KAX77_00390 [Xanthomonadales bacterium]|nr:hypothetical protein [Xanthomonadales bacterium]
MVKFSRATEDELHVLAKAAAVRLQRAEEEAQAADKDSPPILVNHDPSAAVVSLYAGALGDTSRPLMQFGGVQIVGKHSDPKREPIAFVVADPTPQFEPEAIPAFDPAALRKVLQGFGHSPVEVERRVHEARMDAASRGQPIKPDAEPAPDLETICAALEAFSLPVRKSDEQAFEARRRLGETLARQHAELEALEVQATNYQRSFETLSAQLDALMSPPPARRPGVKPAISGLTRTVAEDHRLGRFKG